MNESNQGRLLRSGNLITPPEETAIMERVTPNSDFSTEQMYQLRLLELEAAKEEREAARAEAALQRQHEIRMLEMRSVSHTNEAERRHSGHSTETSRLMEADRICRTVKEALPPMKCDKCNVTKVFQTLESAFALYDVDQSYQAQIALSLIGHQVPNLFTLCDADQLRSYEEIKRVVLTELRMSPKEYGERFRDSRKKDSISHLEFIHELKGYFTLYLECLHIKTFEDLVELSVADQYKNTLANDTLRHILLKEEGAWLKPEVIAKIAQTYEEATSLKPMHKPRYVAPPHRENGDRNRAENKNLQATEAFHANRSFFREHQVNERGSGRRFPVVDKQRSLERSRPHGHAPSDVNKLADRRPDAGSMDNVQCYNCSRLGHKRSSCPQLYNKDSGNPRSKINKLAVIGKNPRDPAAQNAKKIVRPETAKLAYRNLYLGGKCVRTLIDSGCESLVINPDVLCEGTYEKLGAVKMSVACGKEVEGRVVNIAVSLQSNDPSPENIHAVILPNLNSDAIVHPSILRKIREGSSLTLLATQVSEALSIDEDEVEHTTEQLEETSEHDVPSSGEAEEETSVVVSGNENEKANEFAKKQLECETLKEAWSNATQAKGGYYRMNGILMHRERVNGYELCQVILPRSHRHEVLEKAHDGAPAGHLGEKRTIERIRKSFYWPTMKGDVKAYCQSCHSCQTKRVVTIKDRIPIQPITRPENPFEVWVLDVIGPLDPKSSKGHEYMLTAVDACTRWPEAIPIRSPTAKETCEALLTVFGRTGLPRLICSDQGKCFTAGLAKQFNKLLGISPRFATPYHPESVGLCERWNGTLKRMLHHVVQEHGKAWHEYVPLLLFAYRETANATTGVSPYQMVYGHLPNNPVSSLRDLWLGEMKVPTKAADSPIKYVERLRQRLDAVLKEAKSTTETQQEAYAHNYNLRTRPKAFQIGDKVMLLTPSSTNKLLKHWIGPCEVMRKPRDNQYVIRTPENKSRVVHTNMLREYHLRIASMGVILEEDSEDFGKLNYMPVNDNVNARDSEVFQKLLENKELTFTQKKELRTILIEGREVFSENPGLSRVGEHCIRLEPDAKPKKGFPYRTPHALRQEISKQTKELLDKGFIRPSNSPWCAPIVCVTKKDSDKIRLCVDYRHLNRYTLKDSYPMQNSTELLYEIGRANWISTLDLSQGFWQVKLSTESQELTSFVTHEGQFSWKRMPFGLCNASGTFQRILDKVLAKNRKYCRTYIDDVAIFSDTWQDHLRHIKAVLETIREAGMTIKLAKCKFAQRKVKYLGHIIGSGMHGPDLEKTEVIRNMVAPTCKKELRAALGLLGYYREYVPNFAQIAEPLTSMTKKCQPKQIKWSPEADAAFDKLKESLANMPELYTPDLSKPFTLFTDASKYAAGACLAQMDEFGKERPIAFFSLKFTPCQRNWATIEQEAFAVIAALKKFDTWLFNAQVEVVTDHNPLKYLKNGAATSSKLIRWSLALQRYNVKVTYRKGKNHVNADALSRIQYQNNGEFV